MRMIKLMKWLLDSLLGSLFKNLLDAWERSQELKRAKKAGANEQALKNQEKANEQLEFFQEVDNNVSDDDAIDELFGTRK